MTVTVLTKRRHFDFVRSAIPAALCREELEGANGGDCLIGFGTGVIVPAQVLQQFKRAFNFHGACPRFPGRDPHHWAAYEGAVTFGATAHYMTEKIDDGPIVGVVRVGVAKDSSPDAYREIAERCSRLLFVALAPAMAETWLPSTGERWGRKRKRADLLNRCNLRGLDLLEREHREFAFAGFEQHFIR